MVTIHTNDVVAIEIYIELLVPQVVCSYQEYACHIFPPIFDV